MPRAKTEEKSHEQIAIHKHSEWNEIVCMTHMCPECDAQYRIGGTDDEICGMNLGFLTRIPKVAKTSATLKALQGELGIGDVAEEFTTQLECPECKTTHTCSAKLIYKGIQGQANLKDHSFEVVCE